ncbi:MAG: 50S ribosomal protein L35 [Nitrospirae bacterium]|nr:MAG: 50S ribosomal protein L35 [Nitrospirota bacterium]
MPKIKTRRAAAKRFRRTGSGKIRARHAYARHIFTKKSAKRKRNLRKPGILHKSDERRVEKMLPY